MQNYICAHGVEKPGLHGQARKPSCRLALKILTQRKNTRIQIPPSTTSSCRTSASRIVSGIENVALNVACTFAPGGRFTDLR